MTKASLAFAAIGLLHSCERCAEYPNSATCPGPACHDTGPVVAVCFSKQDLKTMMICQTTTNGSGDMEVKWEPPASVGAVIFVHTTETGKSTPMQYPAHYMVAATATPQVILADQHGLGKKPKLRCLGRVQYGGIPHADTVQCFWSNDGNGNMTVMWSNGKGRGNVGFIELKDADEPDNGEDWR